MPDAISRRPMPSGAVMRIVPFGFFDRSAIGRLGLVDGLDDLHRALVEYAAMFGRRQLARRAIEKAHAEMTFEFLDAIAGDGRRSALIAPGGGEVAEFDDANENTKIIKIGHGFALTAYTV